MFGPDGRLYAAQKARKRLVAYSPEGKESLVVDAVSPEDLAISSQGRIYFTDPGARRIWLTDSKGNKRVVHEGRIVSPSGIRVSPDESALLVADNGSRWVWSFQIRPDGSLSNGEPYHHLELPDGVEDGPIRSGAAGLVMDADGFLYTATKLGIQSGSSSAVRICTLYTWRPATQSSAGACAVTVSFRGSRSGCPSRSCSNLRSRG